MLEIIRTMSQEEREYFAKFLLNYPVVVSTPEQKVGITSPQGQEIGRVLRDAPGYVEVTPFDPNPPPLPVGATAAPCSAGVDQIKTALEVSPVIIGSNTNIDVLGQNVVTNEQPVGIVVHQMGSPVPLDSEGLPWDSRIHASTKTKIANGNWKLARGIDPVMVENVKTELRALMSKPAPAPAPAPAPIRTGFVDFMQDITELLATKKLTMGEIIQSCVNVGVSAPNLLGTRPDLIPGVASQLSLIIASKS